MYGSHESDVSREECGLPKKISEFPFGKFFFIRPLRVDDTIPAEQFLEEKEMQYLKVEEFSFILTSWNPDEIIGLYSDSETAFADASAKHYIVSWVQ
jgi:hypothetical protein